LSPHLNEAHQGLSYVLRELGSDAAARKHAALAFADRSVIVLPYRGRVEPVRVLQVISAVGGNAAVERFLDDRTFLTTILVAESFDLEQPLPTHDVAINAVADAELCPGALQASRKILLRTTAPIINDPQVVGATSRADVAARLSSITNVITPRTADVPRHLLTGETAAETLQNHGFHFPFLLRSQGFHTGQYFERVGDANELELRLKQLPGEVLTVIEYLDARGPDGKFRKYRVMMIDGELFPLHLAVSTDWKVHYFTADMTENADHRAEDAAFLWDMPRVLGDKGMSALWGVQKTLGLEYAGIDFGLSPDGRLLLFEANASMNVLTPGPDSRWDYRRPYVQRILDAARDMILKRAKTS
jgi:hypothetical protein